LYVEWLSSSSSSENDVDCPVRRYVVRVRDSLSSSRPRSWRYDASETSAVVSGLRAGSVQRVRLVADDSCRRGRGRMSRWLSVQLPASTVSTPGRITKSVRDLQAHDSTFQSQTFFTVVACFVFCQILHCLVQFIFLTQRYMKVDVKDSRHTILALWLCVVLIFSARHNMPLLPLQVRLSVYLSIRPLH